MIVSQYIAGSNSKASMKDLRQKRARRTKYKEQVNASREIYIFNITLKRTNIIT